VSGRGGTGWITFSVFGLVVMATWTLVIKFLAPVLYFAAEIAGGRPPDGIPIMWDFWWVAHLALAWSLWRRHVWAWARSTSRHRTGRSGDCYGSRTRLTSSHSSSCSWSCSCGPPREPV
jgi:cobalamin synthase